MQPHAAPRPVSLRRNAAMGAMLAGVILALTLGVWFAAYRYFLSEALDRAEARLSLYRSTVIAEVERFEHLTQVLSVDPYVMAAVVDGSSPALNTRLFEFADAAGLDAIFLMDTGGLTIAASNFQTNASFVGETYGFRPYFQAALAGTRGRFYGIGATTGLPGYFIADPVRDEAGAVAGVVAIKINLIPFEDSWRGGGEEVLLTDAQDVVLLASDPGWRYRTLDPLDPDERALIDAARQFPGQDLALLDWQTDGARAEISGVERLYVATDELPFGWQLHFLSTDEAAVTRAWLAAGTVLVLAAIALIFAQSQRTRHLGAALRRSEAEEADLREANERLALEIQDRRKAEMRLQETREELVRASRLAALGQLSASVTHELGQPIAAMRNHLTAHEITTDRTDGKLIAVISGLVERMEAITRQLKFFARSDPEPFDAVDLRDCIASVRELVGPNIDATQTRFVYDRPDQPVVVRGARLRLEQVLTNLFRNGLDAMADAQTRRLVVRLGTGTDGVWIEIEDSGHGLGDANVAHLSEPFVTTRESGEGMGLGLAISAGILADHGGHLEARAAAMQGSVFRVVLPHPSRAELAAE
ncbi:MAG: ATP-binding protein [Pseudomonadota bacterium]